MCYCAEENFLIESISTPFKKQDMYKSKQM